jgi:LytS/YehU family sensor histidine kinase
MQLHPHFLFNTLHGISALIDSDAAGAKTMIVKLSELLRIAVKHGSADLIPLREEMKFVDAYLDLEKMRLGPRIQIDVRIAPETATMLVPQLILQPLIENAIVHGIACCREGGRLEIDSYTAQGALELHVKNTIGGISQHGTGLGLANTRARLKHLYSDMASFSFVISGKHAAEATMRLPVFGSGVGSSCATLELARSATHTQAGEVLLQ